MQLKLLYLACLTGMSLSCSSARNPSIDELRQDQETADAKTQSSDQNADILIALPDEQLPERILDCRTKGVTGSVQNGSYACDQQSLGLCSDLDIDRQKKVVAYASENLSGYKVFACARANALFYVHFFKENNEGGLDIFKLEIEDI